MVFLRKAGYRSKVKKVLLWSAVGWDFSVELLERVALMEVVLRCRMDIPDMLCHKKQI